MNTYPKIQSVYHRYVDDPHKGKFIIGEWSDPVFEYLKNNIWVWKEKVDGTNIRVQYWGSPNTPETADSAGYPYVVVKGRTDKAERIEPLYSNIEKMFPPDWFQEHFEPGVDVCLYGEGYGAGIQKGGKYRSDQSFVLFDIKIDDYWWLQNDAIATIAEDGDIDYIPVKVGQPLISLNMRNGQRVICKIKTKDFIQGR